MTIDVEAERQKMLDRLNELEAILEPRVADGETGAKKSLDDVRSLRARIGG